MLDIASLGYEISFQELQTKWHQAELEFRDEERFRREVEDSRRAANEMAEQLKVGLICLCLHCHSSIPNISLGY